ncbi:urease subunit gamma [Gephyromycinifex aptenodytis]|uniref:urease subunit gamma n=1 Tax=Gephyromycinifex aptenodytis TaxID=2716227 RepID=UPI001445ACDA|nr:urease subunit gamma [Gephyromycinifex aptenodytis]
MHLTPREEERLLIAAAADLARRRLARGGQLGAPDAIALVCDTVMEAAWDGASLAEAIEAGRAAVPAERLRDGVAALARVIEVEALFPHGSVLVHIEAPFGPPTQHGPGAILPGSTTRELAPGRTRAQVTLHNTGHAAVWVSSHTPLDALNGAIQVDLPPQGRWRLDLPAGVSTHIEAGARLPLQAVEILDDNTAGTDSRGNRGIDSGENSKERE